MNRKDGLILALAAALTLCLCLAVSVRLHQRRLPPALQVSASPEVVLGTKPVFLGNPDSPFTLVEFGDYRCRYSLQAKQDIARLLSIYPNTLRFHFRNGLHASAVEHAQAALFAEAAREQGRFWLAYEALFANTAPANRFDSERLLGALHLDPIRLKYALSTSALEAARRDAEDARILEVNGTPAFFLCCPDGRVFRLASLAQLPDLLK